MLCLRLRGVFIFIIFTLAMLSCLRSVEFSSSGAHKPTLGSESSLSWKKSTVAGLKRSNFLRSTVMFSGLFTLSGRIAGSSVFFSTFIG